MKYPIPSALLTTALAISNFSAQAASAPESDDKPACMQDHPDKRAERLKEALQLAPHQQGAWNSYRESMASPGQERHQRDLASTTTPDRLKLMRERLKTVEAEFEQRATATETFYAVLDEEKKRIFDKLSTRYFRKAAHWKHR